MQDHKKQDTLSVNTINSETDIKPTQKNVGNADKDPFCVYGHKRHAVGSKITGNDGPDTVCTKESSWENVKK